MPGELLISWRGREPKKNALPRSPVARLVTSCRNPFISCRRATEAPLRTWRVTSYCCSATRRHRTRDSGTMDGTDRR